MTFFKEGMATMGEFLYQARLAENAAGGPSSPAGRAAFQASLVERVQRDLRPRRHVLDGRAVQSGSVRPLLRRRPPTTGPARPTSRCARSSATRKFTRALRQIQRTYGGASISEPQLEAVFQRWLPVPTRAAHARLRRFFTQWFDTAYPAGGGSHRPTITGPGLAGPGFAGASPALARSPGRTSAQRLRG